MTPDTKKIIEHQIAPLMQNGDLALFLGAGFSIKTPNINGEGIPKTEQLIENICIGSGYSKDDAKDTDLQTAFGIGKDKIDNFDNFLISSFTTTKPHDWQIQVFRYWWRIIFTTNIDDIADKSIELNKIHKNTYPDYQIFNYRDRPPVIRMPITPCLVYLHGTIKKIKEGLIFDAISYADNAVRQTDWLQEAALNIAHGHCIFVGSRFKESDIEVAIRNRELWDDNNSFRKESWIVLDKFSKMDEDFYINRGLTPIKATAEDFFSYLLPYVEQISAHKLLKRRAPHLLDSSDNEALAWFIENFKNVYELINRERPKPGLYSRFYTGDMPNWFYIANNVPARISIVDKIFSEINSFATSKDKVKVITVTGAIGSGKSTAAMIAVAEFAKINNSSVYSFEGINALNDQHLWNSVKDTKGIFVFFIDSSSEYFYAINTIVEKVLDRPTACKLCFVLEERKVAFERNKRHLFKVPKENIISINIPSLNADNAKKLLDKAESLGIRFEKLTGLDNDNKVAKIINSENGYRGDLLATVYDLSHRKSYQEQIKDEYIEIPSEIAKDVFQTISLVTSAKLSIPINYLAEVHCLSIEALLKIIRGDLDGKVHISGTSSTISARHHSISDYHLKHLFIEDKIKYRIIQLMACVSKKFTINDIKHHPISYRIYRSVLSFHWLTETVFTDNKAHRKIHEIYSSCQEMFSGDGIFWLQYGRFLERDGDIEGAIHCLRKGLGLYDSSFQIKHALGQMLLKKYRKDIYKNIEDFDEGYKMLIIEIESRGAHDPYPYVSLISELVKLLKQNPDNQEIKNITKDVINKGLLLHKSDDSFMKVVSGYMQIVSNSSVS